MMGLLLWRFAVVGLCVCVCVCFARRRDGFASLSFFFLLADLGFVIVMVVDL